MKLALYASTFKNPEAAARCYEFIGRALSAGNSVLLHSAACQSLSEAGLNIECGAGLTVGDNDGDLAGCDFIVSLGGDGTFLRAARWSGATGVPVAGVNMGHLGYLPSYNPDDLPFLLQWLENGDYRLEKRSMLMIELPPNSKEDAGNLPWFALNEVAFLKQDTASMITIPVAMDGNSLATYRADGLIVSTPTGSTGYNLSVGGPVLQPTVAAWVLSPIADHSLTMRPMVISDSSTLEITAQGRTDSFRVSLDGNSFTLPASTPVKVKKAPFECHVVVKPDTLFASALRSKLLWGEKRITPDDGATL